MIGIIGAGAWGTALAQIYASAGHDILLWAQRSEAVHAMNETRESAYLPGMRLHPKIKATNDLSPFAKKEIILIATPAQHTRSVLGVIKRWLPPNKPVVICSKGIEIKTGLLMSQMAEDEAPGPAYAVLSGPNFAGEIARGLPAAATVAARDMAAAERICESLASKTLRPYASDDLIGAQVGGAVKNVIAIACGIVVGRKLGENGRAALMTRGLAEMARLAAAMGGKKETLLGLSGVGDLVLTAASMQSRNYSLGVHLGESRSLQDILKERSAVTEGVHTAHALTDLAEKYKVNMPIARAVYQCLHEDMSLDDAIAAMLDRPLRRETA